MEQITNIVSYAEYKQELDNELQRTTEGFFRIGYLLRLARDTNILKDSQYENVLEFAKAEYNLEKSQVSRFISINERFADPEQQDKLSENYKGFGVAKLAIMLQLPDAINEELSQSFSKAEIQTIKEEYDTEKDVSDIERMIEPIPEQIAKVDDNLGKAIIALGEAEPELYVEIHKEASARGRIDIERLKDDLIPNEESIYSIRVPGAGRYMLSLKANGENALTNVREESKEKYTWEEIAAAFYIIINMDKDAKEDWEEQYGKPFPEQEKEEVAPVQQKKSVTKKESRVVKAKEDVQAGTLHDLNPEIPVPNPIKSELKENSIEESESTEETATEEQIPGQDNIQEHTERMPEKTETNAGEKTAVTGDNTGEDVEADKVAADVEYKEIDNTDQDKDSQREWLISELTADEAITYITQYILEGVRKGKVEIKGTVRRVETP